jgi:hypothetical protein
MRIDHLPTTKLHRAKRAIIGSQVAMVAELEPIVATPVQWQPEDRKYERPRNAAGQGAARTGEWLTWIVRSATGKNSRFW